MPDLLDSLLHATSDPVADVLAPAPPVDVMDLMVRKALAVVNADPDLVVPWQRAEYLDVVADVRGYWLKLADEDRHEFEGRIVKEVGVRPVNEFFGYHKPLTPVKLKLNASLSLKEAEAIHRERTSPEFQKLEQNTKASAKKRRTRRVVGDWLEATRAAVEGAKA